MCLGFKAFEFRASRVFRVQGALGLVCFGFRAFRVFRLYGV